MNILLIEDERPAARQLAKMLQSARPGYRILETLDSVAGAVRWLQHFPPPDLIFMDMQMPKMDGLTATKQIRQDCCQQPWIVALTANALPEDRQLCLDAGMNDFITKPIQIENIMNIFARYTSDKSDKYFEK